MNCRFILIFISALVLVIGGAAQARDMESLARKIAGDAQIKNINLETDIGVAELFIKCHDGGDIIANDIYYNIDRLEVDVEFDAYQSTADLFLLSESTSDKLDIDTEDCEWDISLSRDYVWDIDLDIGFAEADLDFSGLPIERFQMDLGAGDFEIVFEEPNPRRLKDIEVDAGAGEIKLIGLGYANFEHMSFDGGAGEFVLDFDGLEEGFHTAEIDVGVGEAKIDFPRGLPVRIVANDSWLNSVNIRGTALEKVEDGVYETDNFEDSDYGLEIDLDLGIGQVTIGWAGGPETTLTVRSRNYNDIYLSDFIFPGIPDLPELPELPEIPQLPSMLVLPELPDLPELPEFGELPPLPDLPSLPELPELEELPSLPALPEATRIRRVLD